MPKNGKIHDFYRYFRLNPGNFDEVCIFDERKVTFLAAKSF